MIPIHRLHVVLVFAIAVWITAAGSPVLAADQKSEFNEELTVNGTEFRLVLASSMEAKALFMTITICGLGHYVPVDYMARSLPEVELLTSDEIPKVLEMRFVRRLKTKQIQQLFEAIIDSESETRSYGVTDADLSRFLALLRGVEKGTSLMLVRNPGGELRVLYDGRPAGIMNSIGICAALWGGLTS